MPRVLQYLLTRKSYTHAQALAYARTHGGQLVEGAHYWKIILPVVKPVTRTRRMVWASGVCRVVV